MINGVATQEVLDILSYADRNMNLEKNLKKLVLCFDNDPAGKDAINSLKKTKIHNIVFNQHIPGQYKDWNDQLILQDLISKRRR